MSDAEATFQVPSLVVIFTPGKTGTKSIYGTLSKYFRVVAPGCDLVHHTHWLGAEAAGGFARAFPWKAPEDVAARADHVGALVERFGRSEDAVVFTTIRDPVERARSDFYYRCPDVLARCLKPDGSLDAASGLAALLRITAQAQFRKEADWWERYRSIFGFRLRDVPEIAGQGYAIRKSGKRTAVILKLSQMHAKLPEIVERLGWPPKYLRFVRGNESPVDARTRQAFEAAVPLPREVVAAAECLEDWIVAYPELGSLAPAASLAD